MWLRCALSDSLGHWHFRLARKTVSIWLYSPRSDLYYYFLYASGVDHLFDGDFTESTRGISEEKVERNVERWRASRYASTC